MFSLRLLTFGLFSPGVEHSDRPLPPLWGLAGGAVVWLSSLEQVLCELSSQQPSWRLEAVYQGVAQAPCLWLSLLSGACPLFLAAAGLCPRALPAASPRVQRASSHPAGPGRGCPPEPDPQLSPLPGSVPCDVCLAWLLSGAVRQSSLCPEVAAVTCVRAGPTRAT